MSIVLILIIFLLFLTLMRKIKTKTPINPITPLTPSTPITPITPLKPNCCQGTCGQNRCGQLTNMYQPCDDPFSWGPTYSTGPNPHFFDFRRTPTVEKF
jgi:hypothetical protein